MVPSGLWLCRKETGTPTLRVRENGPSKAEGVKIMSKVSLNAKAPDFVLEDYQGNPVSLSDYYGKKNVLLVFNRGFT